MIYLIFLFFAFNLFLKVFFCNIPASKAKGYSEGEDYPAKDYCKGNNNRPSGYTKLFQRHCAREDKHGEFYEPAYKT